MTMTVTGGDIMNETKDTVFTVREIDENDPDLIGVPPELIVHSEEELLERLAESERDVREGRVRDAFEMLMEVRQKYCM